MIAAGLLVVALSLGGRAFAEWKPVLRLEGYGGRIHAASRSSSLTGSGSWLVGGGLRLSDKDLVIPSLSGGYQRSYEVQQVVNEGVLQRERLDTTASLRWVHNFDERWAVKPSASYKRESANSGTGDKIGRGLFDYDKAAGGLEVERKSEGWSITGGLSSYLVQFPRFRQSQSDGTRGFGDRVLDFTAYEASLRGACALGERTRLGLEWSGSLRAFNQQRIVLADGTAGGEFRRDLMQSWAASVTRRLQTVELGFGGAMAHVEHQLGARLAYNRLDSNQNAFDPSRAAFDRGAYDFDEARGGPQYSFSVGRGRTSLSYEIGARYYRSRPALNSAGSPEGSAVRQLMQAASARYSRPLMTGLEAKAGVDYNSSLSNMAFQGLYSYRYTLWNYMLGLGYSF